MSNTKGEGKDALKEFWTTDQSVLLNRAARKITSAPGRFQQRLDRYIFKRAIQSQGFDVDTHHCARSPWYESALSAVRSSGLPTRDFDVRGDEFDDYLSRQLPVYESQGYVTQYGGLHGYFHEKALEHFLSIKVLQPGAGTRLLDIASWGSPAAEILAKETGAQLYKHDLTFKTDIENHVISGPAEALDAPDQFFDMLMAHCAIDNFEGPSDSWLLKDAARVVKPGGRFLIIPLHMADRAENLVALGGSNVALDEEATLVVKPAAAARFCRHYSVESLRRRILLMDSWTYEVLIFQNLPIAKYPNTQNCRFGLLATRRG